MAKSWADGETLTAAAMNEVTSTSNLRFANAAERDATLVGGLAPVEGMTATTLDNNITWKYITVSGASYWAPQAGTLCFYAYQLLQQAFMTTAINVIAPIDGIVGSRNLNNWYDPYGGFTPQCPGYYQFFGGLGIFMQSSTTVAQVSLFTAQTGMIQSTRRDYVNTANNVMGFFGFRRHTVYMNGTTDYMKMAVNGHSANDSSAQYNMGGNSAWGAIYLGL